MQPYKKLFQEGKFKIGDIVQKDDGTVIRITAIKNNFIDGDYYGIRGYIKGKITTVSMNDITLYKFNTKWLKEKKNLTKILER